MKQIENFFGDAKQEYWLIVKDKTVDGIQTYKKLFEVNNRPISKMVAEANELSNTTTFKRDSIRCLIGFYVEENKEFILKQIISPISNGSYHINKHGGLSDYMNWEEELKAQETLKNNHQIFIYLSSTDCDLVSSGKVKAINSFADFDEYVENTYDWAEGPTSIDVLSHGEYLNADEFRKDHITEAFENGQGMQIIIP